MTDPRQGDGQRGPAGGPPDSATKLPRYYTEPWKALPLVAKVGLGMVGCVVIGAIALNAEVTTRCEPPREGASRGRLPDVVGAQLDEAKDRLCEAGFPEVESFDATSDDRMQFFDSNWRVVSQDPHPPSRTPFDTEIELGVVKEGETPMRPRGTSDSTPPPPQSTSDEPSQSEISDFAFLSSIKAAFPEFDDAPDEQLVSTGHNICTRLNTGETFDSIAASILESSINNGFSATEAGAVAGVLLGAAVAAYCEEHQANLDAFFAIVDEVIG